MVHCIFSQTALPKLIKIKACPHHENKNFIKKTPEVNPLKFNNFEAREYDYDSLEKKLLGWDKDD